MVLFIVSVFGWIPTMFSSHTITFGSFDMAVVSLVVLLMLFTGAAANKIVE
jgi:hypothetical protein